VDATGVLASAGSSGQPVPGGTNAATASSSGLEPSATPAAYVATYDHPVRGGDLRAVDQS
jgi:hypothetical protein